jgi:hypothetical protein
MEETLPMSTPRKRFAVVTGTALALVLSGASIVSAQTDTTTPQQVPLQGIEDIGGDQDALTHGARGDRGGRGFGGGQAGRGGQGLGGGLRGAVLERYDGLVSQTVVRVDADGNILTDKVEHGTVSAVADGSITIDLATGESVTIATDANTAAFSWDTSGRPLRSEIAVADVAVGADVMVWSESQDDGSFLAQRVAVLPAAVTTDSTDDSATPDASPAATVG